MSARPIVGVVDEPSLQRQRPLILDFETDGSVLVYGSSGSGKTTLLRTIACALAASTSPAELNLYALDFATRGLMVLEQLPHCGSAIAGEEEERVQRLFSLLQRTMAERKRLLAEAGVASLSEYRRRQGEAPPRIVVLLDGYAGFLSAFERVNLGALVDALPRVLSEGRPLGVHFVITADRRGSVPSAISGLIPRKIVLRMADNDEYASLGVNPRTARDAFLPAGRGFVGDLEVQCAAAGEVPTAEAQNAAIVELAAGLERRYSGLGVAPVRTLPEQVDRASLGVPSEAFEVVLGLSDDLEPSRINLADGHFLIVGPYRSGRTTALETMVDSLRRGPMDFELHLFAPRRSHLTELPFWATCAKGHDACEAALPPLIDRFLQDAEVGPAIVVIDDAEELADSSANALLEGLVRRARDLQVRVLAAAERQGVQRAFGGFIRELRKDEFGLLLDPDIDVDGDLVGARLPRGGRTTFPVGRGYLARRGLVELIQVASPSP